MKNNIPHSNIPCISLRQRKEKKEIKNKKSTTCFTWAYPKIDPPNPTPTPTSRLSNPGPQHSALRGGPGQCRPQLWTEGTRGKTSSRRGLSFYLGFVVFEGKPTGKPFRSLFWSWYLCSVVFMVFQGKATHYFTMIKVTSFSGGSKRNNPIV